VLTEAAWILHGTPWGYTRIVSNLKGGLFALAVLDAEDLARIHEIMERYEDSGIRLANAALAHLAERENFRTIFSLDRRDFSMIGLKRNRSLAILPELS